MSMERRVLVMLVLMGGADYRLLLAGCDGF